MLGTLFPSNLSTKVTKLLRKKKEGEVYFCSDLGKSKVVTKLAKVYPTSGSMYMFSDAVSL